MSADMAPSCTSLFTLLASITSKNEATEMITSQLTGQISKLVGNFTHMLNI